MERWYRPSQEALHKLYPSDTVSITDVLQLQDTSHLRGEAESTGTVQPGAEKAQRDLTSMCKYLMGD